jgi:hypothetical protein
VDRDQLLSLPLENGSGHNLLPLLLGILVLAPPTEKLAIEFFGHVATTLARAWGVEAEEGRRSMNSKFDDDVDGLDYEKEVLLSRNLAQFLLNMSPEEALQAATPVLDAVLVYPEHGSAFLERLISAQDQRKPTTTFWAIWQAILDRLLAAIGQKPETTKNEDLPKLLNKIFLGVDWKHDTRDWPPLAGEAHRVEAAFSFFAPHAAIIQYYLGFLRRIGSARLLPATLVTLAKRIAARPAAQLLSPYSVRCLEEILGRLIYSDPSKLKATPEMRAAVLSLLNACIEMGSSVCYRQRDDFLTPSTPK